MAFLITRTAVVPVWLLACVLVVVLTTPSGLMATGLLLISGLAAATIIVFGRLAPQPQPSVVRPNSWPDSGFRIPRRGARGR